MGHRTSCVFAGSPPKAVTPFLPPTFLSTTINSRPASGQILRRLRSSVPTSPFYSLTFLLRASCFLPHASRFLLHTPRFLLHAPCFTLHASCFTLHASCFTLHASCFLLLVSCFTLLASCLTFQPRASCLSCFACVSCLLHLPALPASRVLPHASIRSPTLFPLAPCCLFVPLSRPCLLALQIALAPPGAQVRT